MKEPRELTAEGDKIAPQQNPSEMAQTLETLSVRLHQLQVEDWLDSGVVSLTKPKEKDTIKALESKIDGLKAGPEDQGSDQLASGLVYELYCKADRDRVKELGRVAALEQRIKRMESLIGSDERKISYLTALTNDRTIVDAVNVLGAKVSQLDSSVLEAIDGRLTSLGKKLEIIAEKKPQTDTIEQQRQINELYEIAMAGEKHSQQLPLIMSRLSTLSEVQQEGKICQVEFHHLGNPYFTSLISCSFLRSGRVFQLPHLSIRSSSSAAGKRQEQRITIESFERINGRQYVLHHIRSKRL